MNSWITSVGGILAAIGQIAQQAPIPPKFAFIPALITAAGTAILGLGAKDYNVHSTTEQVKEATLEAQK